MEDRITSLIIRELAYELKINDAMSSEVISISPEDTMVVVREILRDNRISGLPVVVEGKLVGIISTENLINCLMSGEGCELVSDHMAPGTKHTFSYEPLIHAVRQFEQYGYGRFPVIDRSTEKLVGIITKGDIIKCILKRLESDFQEEEIQRYRARHIFKDIDSDQTSITFKYLIKGGEYSSAGEQSNNLKVNLLRLGVAPKISRRVTIASCEAEMNIIIFTPGGEITVSVEDDRIVVNATDSGPGIPDVEQAMGPGFSTAPDWIRELGFGAGMGLPNIKNVTDEMHIDTTVGKGTNLQFVVNT